MHFNTLLCVLVNFIQMYWLNSKFIMKITFSYSEPDLMTQVSERYSLVRLLQVVAGSPLEELPLVPTFIVTDYCQVFDTVDQHMLVAALADLRAAESALSWLPVHLSE